MELKNAAIENYENRIAEFQRQDLLLAKRIDRATKELANQREETEHYKKMAERNLVGDVDPEYLREFEGFDGLVWPKVCVAI